MTKELKQLIKELNAWVIFLLYGLCTKEEFDRFTNIIWRQFYKKYESPFVQAQKN